MNIIEVNNLTKTYGTLTAVDHISFTVEQGSMLGFLGINGAGKSTAINMLSTLLRPDSGTATICGHRLGHEDEQIRRKIGIVYQQNVLDDLLSVRENLLCRGILHGASRRQAASQLERLCKILKLEDILKRSGNEMVIRQNKSRYDALRRAREERNNIERTKDLRRNYFEHVEKANCAADDGKLKKAMKEYRRADHCWCEYFRQDYKKDSRSEEMPENKFFDDAVDHMMVLYVETHPILTSKKKHLKIHSEILEILDGRWDGRIAEADRRAQEVLDEKHRKRQELFNRAGDIIVGARIVGDKIFQRFGK